MKKTIFITATVLMSSLGLAGLTLASSQDSKAGTSSAVQDSKTGNSSTVESDMGSSGMGSSGMGSSSMGSSSMGSSDMASMNQQKDAASLSADQVRELQNMLKEEGYKVGNVDGIIGPVTTGAIRQYQTDRDLEVSGTANDKTLRSLAPDREKQEFFGLAPEFGDNKEGMKSDKQGINSDEQGTMPEKKPVDADPMKKGN